MHLSPRHEQVYRYIERYTDWHGDCPSVAEIRRHFGLKSVVPLQRILSRLTHAGMLKNDSRRRFMKPAAGWEETEPVFMVPLLGIVKAGTPIEAILDHQMVGIPPDLVSPDRLFALRVKGDSMIEDCIYEDDVIIIKPMPQPENGQTVVALIDGSDTTVKRYYNEGHCIRLVAANPAYDPLVISPPERVVIQGIVVALIRKFMRSQKILKR